MSCCTMAETALYMSDIRQLCKTRFFIKRGVTTFDYCHKNNMIVTAGQDCIVRFYKYNFLSHQIKISSIRLEYGILICLKDRLCI